MNSRHPDHSKSQHTGLPESRSATRDPSPNWHDFNFALGGTGRTSSPIVSQPTVVHAALDSINRVSAIVGLPAATRELSARGPREVPLTQVSFIDTPSSRIDYDFSACILTALPVSATSYLKRLYDRVVRNPGGQPTTLGIELRFPDITVARHPDEAQHSDCFEVSNSYSTALFGDVALAQHSRMQPYRPASRSLSLPAVEVFCRKQSIACYCGMLIGYQIGRERPEQGQLPALQRLHAMHALSLDGEEPLVTDPPLTRAVAKALGRLCFRIDTPTNKPHVAELQSIPVACYRALEQSPSFFVEHRIRATTAVNERDLLLLRTMIPTASHQLLDISLTPDGERYRLSIASKNLSATIGSVSSITTGISCMDGLISGLLASSFAP